jgi:hypothetical protein
MPKVFICTPAFEGKVYAQYTIALAETFRLLGGHGIESVLRISVSGSLLCAERNRLTEQFMQTDCTHMLCIDSDIGWPPQAVIAMLQRDKDFIAGCYPARTEKVFLFRPVFNEDNSLKVNVEQGLIRMTHVPAGFMLIKRKVIEKMREKFPELYFEPKHPDNHTSKGHCLFQTMIMDGEFWGEDYVFCQRAIEAGFEIWVDPMIEFDHAGNKGALYQTFTENKPEAIAKQACPT